MAELIFFVMVQPLPQQISYQPYDKNSYLARFPKDKYVCINSDLMCSQGLCYPS